MDIPSSSSSIHTSMKPPGTASDGTLTRIVFPLAAINSKDPPGTAPICLMDERKQDHHDDVKNE